MIEKDLRVNNFIETSQFSETINHCYQYFSGYQLPPQFGATKSDFQATTPFRCIPTVNKCNILKDHLERNVSFILTYVHHIPYQSKFNKSITKWLASHCIQPYLT